MISQHSKQTDTSPKNEHLDTKGVYRAAHFVGVYEATCINLVLTLPSKSEQGNNWQLYVR